MNKTSIIIVSIIIILLIAIFIFVSFSREYEMDDNSNLLSLEILVEGKVRDIYFNPIVGEKIFFGEQNERVVAVTDANGRFEFTLLVTRYTSSPTRIKDHIALDATKYDYNIIGIETQTEHEKIDLVCSPKGLDVNVFELLSYSNKITFHLDGLPLPNDYYNLGKYGGVTKNGETRLIGVEFYVGDNLIGISHKDGFEIGNVYPGTIITLKKEGFTFVELLRGGTSIPLVAYDSDGNAYSDSFNAPFNADPFPLNIRATLIEGVSIEDLDL